MEKITFQIQYDKIVNAYYQDKLNPYQCCGCFVGNLLDNEDMWRRCKPGLFLKEGSNIRKPTQTEIDNAIKIIREKSGGLYTPEEIFKIEAKFMSYFRGTSENWKQITPDFENTLFKAMESTLIMLKEIHESKGEIVPSYDFKKRELIEA